MPRCVSVEMAARAPEAAVCRMHRCPVRGLMERQDKVGRKTVDLVNREHYRRFVAERLECPHHAGPQFLLGYKPAAEGNVQGNLHGDRRFSLMARRFTS